MTSDGTPWRPVVHVEDICQAFACALEAPAEAVNGEVFNVGPTAENYRIRELAEIVAAEFPGCEVTRRPERRRQPQLPGVVRQDRSRLARVSPAAGPRAPARPSCSGCSSASSSTQATHQFRAYTRLKQLRYLRRTGQIDDRFLLDGEAVHAAVRSPRRRRWHATWSRC